MNVASVAVWLLELVTTPERATTTVGDFTEEVSTRGRLWFWQQVTATFFGHLTREFTTSPVRLLGSLLAAATLFYLGVEYLLAAFLKTLSVLIPPEALGHAVVFEFAMLYAVIGWAISRISKRTFAAPTLFALLIAATPLIRQILHFRMIVIHFTPSFAAFAVPFFLMLPGAIWQRRRAVRALRTTA